MNKLLSIPLILLVVISILVVFPTASYAQAVQPGPASDKIILRRYAIADAPAAIKAGDIDFYMYSLRPAQAEVLRGAENVTLYSAAAGLIELTLNPAPVYVDRVPGKITAREAAARFGVPLEAITGLYYEEINGTTYTVIEFGAFPGKGVNPFAFREIRFALNYVVDRATIAATILRGFGVPMYTFLSQYDPDYAVIADIIAKYEFTYNPDYARSVVDRVMSAIGATKSGGKWYYEGQPITLRIIIRPEDERRDIGYTFNAELKLLGFETQPMEMPFAQAINVIYGTNPAEFQWHVYTAGWGKGGIDKYDSVTIAQFCAPWVGYMPGWGETGWWQYRHDEIDEITLKIYRGEFKNKEERNELYRRGTELCIQESVRIWVAARLDTWPVRAEVKGVTLDLGAGLRGIWNLREMYREDRKELYGGHLYVWTATSEWNWWGGFTDVYSVDPARATYDPSVWAHPFNGLPIAFRTPFVVQTKGPDGKLDVPTTAKIWDVTTKQWVNVPAGTQATSKVVFDLSKLVGTKFHNGITITMADVVGYVALLYELVYDPTYSALEPRISGNTKPWLDTIKGWEFDDANKRMTVYVDYWHFDENYIGSWAAISFGNPIEIHVASFELALDRRNETNIVFYRRAGFETLSLVVSRHVDLLKNTLLSYVNNAAVLEKVRKLTDGRMTMDEWNARINADINWINTYNLAWISYGPFMLTKLDTSAQILELTAFRDPTYPFKKGDWYFGVPVATEIVKVEYESPIPGKIAPGYSFNVTVTLSGIPPLGLKYIIKDAAGNIVATGDGVKVTDTVFKVILDPDFTSGLPNLAKYTIILVGVSDVVAVPGIKREVLEVASVADMMKLTQEATQEAMEKLRQDMENRMRELQESIIKTLGESVANTFAQLRETINITFTRVRDVVGARLDSIEGKIGELPDKVISGVDSRLSGKYATPQDVEGVKESVASLQNLVIVNIVLTVIALIASFIAVIRKGPKPA